MTTTTTKATILHGWAKPAGHPRSDEPVPYRAIPGDYGRKPSATGYGAGFPAYGEVQWEGRWRKLYCDCYGNDTGTPYFRAHGEQFYVRVEA